MVPADNEQHPETTQQQLSSDNTTSTHSNDAPRLTPMPRWLMHWWTPIVFAVLFLIICTPIAFWWGGHFHWPSPTAMSLCVTIAGAGFALSAWQQRSHDNAANAKEAQAAIERDDYWKRREQIYQLLGSKNPGLRLSAVALLAELADSAAHSNLLNENEKQQLQSHIIDTLCLQVRHEGLCIKEEGDKREHTTIQQTILMSIFQRMNCPQQDRPVANWSESIIRLNSCTILTPVSIRSIITNSTLDLLDTTFEEKVEISESVIKNILWDTTHFNSHLNVTNSSDIGMLRPPTYGRSIHFRDTTIRIPNTPGNFTIYLPPSKQKRKIYFTECRFYDTSCKCTNDCKCRIISNPNTCQCSIKNTCTCENACINTTLWITTPHAPREEEEQYPEITIENCTIGHLRLLPEELGARMTIKSNLIHETLQLFIGHRKPTDAIRTYIHKIDKSIILEDNVIQIPDAPKISPIIFLSKNYCNIDKIISFNNISLRLGAKSTHESKVSFQKTTTSFDLFHFTTLPSFDHQDTLKISWDTGSPSSTYHKALACNINQHNTVCKIKLAKIEHLDFVAQAYEVTHKVMSEYAMEADWPDDYFSFGYAVEDIEQSNCYIVYTGDTPSAAFTLKSGSDETNLVKGIQWRAKMDHHTIQRIAAANGEAVARSIFDYAATRDNYLRCLTHEQNNILRHALEAFGFKKCGTFTAEDGTTRVAYDWIKEPESQD